MIFFILLIASIIGIYDLAGEMASKVSRGPGSLRMNLLDKLYNISSDEIISNVKIKNV